MDPRQVRRPLNFFCHLTLLCHKAQNKNKKNKMQNNVTRS